MGHGFSSQQITSALCNSCARELCFPTKQEECWLVLMGVVYKECTVQGCRRKVEATPLEANTRGEFPP